MNLPARRILRPIVPASLLIVGVLGLSACGTETLDGKKVESTVVEQFRAQGVPLHDVSCKDVEAKVGSPVRCTGVNPSSTKLFIEGKVTSRSGSKAHFEVKAVRGESKGTVVAKQVTAIFEQQVKVEAEGMSCPATVEFPTKRPFRCVATVSGGERHNVDVTVDGKGETSIDVDTKALP